MTILLGMLPLLVRAVEESKAENIGPGLLAFGVVALLALATFLLIRSMLHHIRKVPPTFEPQEPQKPSGPEAG
jgi:hypothetical protein